MKISTSLSANSVDSYDLDNDDFNTEELEEAVADIQDTLEADNYEDQLPQEVSVYSECVKWTQISIYNSCWTHALDSYWWLHSIVNQNAWVHVNLIANWFIWDSCLISQISIFHVLQYTGGRANHIVNLWEAQIYRLFWRRQTGSTHIRYLCMPPAQPSRAQWTHFYWVSRNLP